MCVCDTQREREKERGTTDLRVNLMLSCKSFVFLVLQFKKIFISGKKPRACMQACLCRSDFHVRVRQNSLTWFSGRCEQSAIQWNHEGGWAPCQRQKTCWSDEQTGMYNCSYWAEKYVEIRNYFSPLFDLCKIVLGWYKADDIIWEWVKYLRMNDQR